MVIGLDNEWLRREGLLCLSSDTGRSQAKKLVA
jgi:hypothetical protein